MPAGEWTKIHNGGHRGSSDSDARAPRSAFTDPAFEQLRETLILDQCAGEPDPLVEADEVRTGVDMDFAAGRLDRCPQKRAGRAFAIGTRNVENGW